MNTIPIANRQGQEGNGSAHPLAEQAQPMLMDTQAQIESAVRQILVSVGEDPNREGLQGTPNRVARAYAEMLDGYDQDLVQVVNGALFDAEYGEGEMVVVSDIEFTSMCEHHLLPFVGKVHVGYLPRDKVLGLSKIPRIVDMFAHRLQMQERLTNQIADAIHQSADAAGVMVMVEGSHSCASLRGAKKQGAMMVTTAQRGEFRSHRELREEFYRLIGRRQPGRNDPRSTGAAHGRRSGPG